MYKNLKKAIALATCVMTLGSVVACGGEVLQDDGKGKTVINVGVFNGGYGYQWLQNAATKFEKLNENYKNGENTGVKIKINPDRQAGQNIIESIRTNTNDMCFTEQMSNWYDFIDGNYLLDITDIVQDEDPYGQGHSIESSLKEGVADMFKVKEADKEHYYTLPYANAFVGLTYDEELFYNKGLFLTREYDENGNESYIEDDYVIRTTPTPADGVFATLTTEGGVNYYKTYKGDYLSMGPDGEYGTYDDGTPRTYKEFFNLCDYMVNTASVSPFVFGGKVANYLVWLLDQFWADYSGAEQTKLNFTFDGELKDLISVDKEGNITELPDVTLVPDNANGNALSIAKTRGRYEALQFLMKMYSNDGMYLHSDCKASFDQYTGQSSFMLSKKSSNKGAFLMDGIWWENEATIALTFQGLEELHGDAYKKGNRRFKQLSLPKASIDKLGEKATIVDTGYQMAFIYSSIDENKKDIAKQFLQFCFTDAMNLQFTLDTSLPRPYTYTIGENDLKKITSYGKSLINVFENSNIVYPFSSSAYYKKNDQLLTPHTFFYSTVNNYKYTSIIPLIENANISQAFNGIYNYLEDTGI